jgi:transposase
MSDSSPSSYDAISVPTVEELASFDPQSSPSPVVADDSVRITAKPSFGMLSPEMKARVTEKLTSIPVTHHEEMTPGVIMDELRQHSFALRVKMGLGPSANEYEREYFCIAREAYDIDREMARTQTDIDEVAGYTSATDDAGEPIAIPVYRFAEETRQGRAEHLQSLRHKRSQLERESAERLRQAAERERSKRLDLNDRAAIEREARTRADELDRNARIEEKAKAINRNRDTIR